jgi:hypothetical protein
MSDVLAQMGPEAALARRYAPPIQVYPAADFRSREMVGAAVETMVASSAATNTYQVSSSARFVSSCESTYEITVDGVSILKPQRRRGLRVQIER